MTEEMKEQKVRLSYSLFIDCPECGQTVDLEELDGAYGNIISKALFSSKWEELEGLEIKCSNLQCDCRFTVGKIK